MLSKLNPISQFPNDGRQLCRYGADCYQRNPEHHQKFSHPTTKMDMSDEKKKDAVAGWTAEVEAAWKNEGSSMVSMYGYGNSSDQAKKVQAAVDAATKSVSDVPTHDNRTECKHGDTCHQKNPEHKMLFKHPPGWSPGGVVEPPKPVFTVARIEGGRQDGRRPDCRNGAGCTQPNPEHKLWFSHPPGWDPAHPLRDQVDKRGLCKWGADCKQKNPEHQVMFRHPPGWSFDKKNGSSDGSSSQYYQGYGSSSNSSNGSYEPVDYQKQWQQWQQWQEWQQHYQQQQSANVPKQKSIMPPPPGTPHSMPPGTAHSMQPGTPHSMQPGTPHRVPPPPPHDIPPPSSHGIPPPPSHGILPPPSNIMPPPHGMPPPTGIPPPNGMPPPDGMPLNNGMFPPNNAMPPPNNSMPPPNGISTVNNGMLSRRGLPPPPPPPLPNNEDPWNAVVDKRPSGHHGMNSYQRNPEHSEIFRHNSNWNTNQLKNSNYDSKFRPPALGWDGNTPAPEQARNPKDNRPPCKYGEDCPNLENEHQVMFWHPEPTGPGGMSKAAAMEYYKKHGEYLPEEFKAAIMGLTQTKPNRDDRRQFCRYGLGCKHSNEEHKNMFQHPPGWIPPLPLPDAEPIPPGLEEEIGGRKAITMKRSVDGSNGKSSASDSDQEGKKRLKVDTDNG